MKDDYATNRHYLDHLYISLFILPLQLSDKNKRAEKMLQNADRLGCRKFVRSKVTQKNELNTFPFVGWMD